MEVVCFACVTFSPIFQRKVLRLMPLNSQTTRFLQFFLIPFYPPPTRWGCGQHTSPPCLPPVAESPAVDFQFPSFCEVHRCSVVSGQFLDPVQLLPERTNGQVSSFWVLAFQNWKNPKIKK